MKIFRSNLVILLLFSVTLEIGLQTWWNKQWGDYASPTIMFLAGLATCWLVYRLIAFEKPSIPMTVNHKINVRKIIVIISFFLIGTILIGWEYHQIQLEFPSQGDGTRSDVIPSLKIYVQRFLSGEYPYQPLVFNGWTVMPTYFPMMWLPYCFSEILEIDYRWTAYLFFLIPLFMLQWQLIKQDISLFEIGLKVALPFIFLFLYVEHFPDVLGYGVELMPVGLYFILVLSMKWKKSYWVAFPIVLVLMSRYAFTFWLPVYLLTIWMERGFKDVFKVSLWVLGGVLVVYVIPFLSKNWDVFFEGLAYYGKTAETAWQWQREDGRPLILINGLSHAIYFYDFVDGDLMNRLRLNRLVHLGMCLIVAAGVFYYYWKNRKRGLNVSIYLLIGLKLYLVVFYSFFYVPFSYLFMLPMFLTIPLLYQIRFFSNS
ncbi:MAG: hypothetical protein P8M17_03515 [Saprospiraceae bacterium]|nr:hypothetical protein [Saprospiraceae bacterium]MDG2418037.1 hypothetical protein [Saprospiraceae bacterium]